MGTHTQTHATQPHTTHSSPCLWGHNMYVCCVWSVMVCGCGSVVVLLLWCCGLWCDTLKNPVCGFKNASVCTFKTCPCVPAKRPCAQITWAFEVDAENVRPSLLHHLPGAKLFVATALKITVFTKINVNMHMYMSVCAHFSWKMHSGIRTFHDVCCSKLSTIHNGFMCFCFS